MGLHAVLVLPRPTHLICLLVFLAYYLCKTYLFPLHFFPIRLLNLGIGGTEVLLILSLREIYSFYLFVCLLFLFINFFSLGLSLGFGNVVCVKTNKRTEKKNP